MHSAARSKGMTWTLRLACLAVILLASGLCLHRLGAVSLWYDEIVQVSLASRMSLRDIIRVHLSSAAAPLDPLLSKAVLSLGRAEFVLRFPAACFAILSVALCFALGRAMFGSLEGLLAAFLMAISAFHIQYAQEVRTYALLGFIGALALWFLWRALRDDHLRDWAAWTALGWLGLCAHPFAALWVLAQACYGVTASAFNRSIGGSEFWTQASRLRRMLVCAGLVLLGAGAQFALAAGDFLKRPAGAAAATPSVFDNWIQPVGHLLVQLGNGAWAAFLCLGVILCAFLTSRREDRAAIWLLGLSGLIPGALAIIAGRAAFVARYVIFVLPPWTLLVARGTTGLARTLQARLQPGPTRNVTWYTVTLALGVAAFGLAGLMRTQEYYTPNPTDWRSKADWRGAGRYLIDHAEPDALVLANTISPLSGYGDVWVLECLPYYFPQAGAGMPFRPAKQLGRAGQRETAPGEVWCAVYHPDGLLAPSVLEVDRLEFHKLTLLRSRAGETPGAALESVLQGLLELQQTTGGRFELHLALARVYAGDGQAGRAERELQAAREQSLSSLDTEAALATAAALVRLLLQH